MDAGVNEFGDLTCPSCQANIITPLSMTVLPGVGSCPLCREEFSVTEDVANKANGRTFTGDEIQTAIAKLLEDEQVMNFGGEDWAYLDNDIGSLKSAGVDLDDRDAVENKIDQWHESARRARYVWNRIQALKKLNKLDSVPPRPVLHGPTGKERFPFRHDEP